MPQLIDEEVEVFQRDTNGMICFPSLSLDWARKSREIFCQGGEAQFENHAKVVDYVRSLVSKIHVSIRYSLISTHHSSPYNAMTYQQLADHIVSVRNEHIQKLGRPILLKYYGHPRNFNIFNEPVDPVLHNVPTYFDVITEPMDFGTIKCKLNAGSYSELSDCFRDMRLVFANAIKFNGSESFVGKAAIEMLTEFESDIADLEDKNEKLISRKSAHSCSSCAGAICLLCGEKCLKLENTTFFCQGSCAQKIKKGGIYYVSTDALNIWCQKCHQSLPPLLGSYVDPDSKEVVTLAKKDLLKRRHDEEITEPWVECDQCGIWMHQICALFIDMPRRQNSFVCPVCVLESAAIGSAAIDKSTVSRSHVIPSDLENECTVDVDSVDSELSLPVMGSSLECVADDSSESGVSGVKPLNTTTCYGLQSITANALPVVGLSRFLEELIKELLVAYGFSDAARTICIRVTSNIERSIEVNVPLQEFAKQLYGTKLEMNVPYRQKCIQLFQEIDGVSVVLFSLYVHEFDKHCPAPNTSTVYIAYLDSTDYFRPAQMRSFVYQEMVVGYMIWARARGFEHCHIWACPPQRGDNFIFWCHPSHQRTPSRDRLNAWYHSILGRAKRLGVHDGVTHLWASFFASLPTRSTETSTREAAKRSQAAVAAVTSARKHFKKNKSSKITEQLPDAPDEISGVFGNSTDVSASTNSMPPIFEGDFWILELTRFYQCAVQRVQNACQQQVSHSKNCRGILRLLFSLPFASAFKEPVDAVALGIPNYFEVIRSPMDLGTVRMKLDRGMYETVLDFSKDVRLTFDNARKFNPPGHPVHINADLMSKEFEKKLSEIVSDARKIHNLTLRNSSTAVSEEILLSCCKLAPLKPLEKTSKLNPDNEDAGGSAGDPKSNKTRKRQSNSMLIETEKRPRLSIGVPSLPEIKGDGDSCGISRSPTSVFEGRREELFLDGDYLKKRSPFVRQVSEQSTVFDDNGCEDETLKNLDEEVSTVKLSDRCSNAVPSTCITNHDPKNQAPVINVQSFLADFSKAIHRLDDDLFVVHFSPPSSRVVELGDKTNDMMITGLVPPGVGAKARKAQNMFLPTVCMELLRNVPSDTSDPDPICEQPLVDSRHTFLEMSQFRHMQFDTLRRAKHSSLMMVFHQLHRCDKYCGLVCSHCGDAIRGLRWHCEQCPGFEVCHHCMIAKSQINGSSESRSLAPDSVDGCVGEDKLVNLSSHSAATLVVPDETRALREGTRRETRRRDCQWTQRREDSMFVYTPIISTHRQNQQQIQHQLHRVEEQCEKPQQALDKHKRHGRTKCRGKKNELPQDSHLISTQRITLSTSSTDSHHLPPLEVSANDFGLFPGHPHPLTPFRVTYES